MDFSEEFAKANQALQAGDYNTATSLCQKILDANPTPLGALSLLCIGYYQSHDYDSAVSAFQLVDDQQKTDDCCHARKKNQILLLSVFHGKVLVKPATINHSPSINFCLYSIC